MMFRTQLLWWVLRLSWPPFSWLFRFYYWLAIQFSRLLISRVPSVRSIYLTGSWVRQDVICGLSDIDFKVLVAGAKNQEVYQTIRRRFSLLRRFFPMLGPPDEKGIYFVDSFESDYRHYPLVQHLFDSRYFMHRKIWGEDLMAILPVQPWSKLDQDECAFGRLRDWTERIHLLADFEGLAAPQKQHLFFKAVSDVAALAIRTENPEATFSRRAEILDHICPELEEPYRPLIENLILENRDRYRRQLNSTDACFRLFKRMVAHCCEKIARKDSADRFPLKIERHAAVWADGDKEILDTLKGFSSAIRNVRLIRWPQLPLNPFDLNFYNTAAYLAECSGPISLDEFHHLKVYCRNNLRQKAQVLLREDAYFLSAVDAILVDHWGSYSGSSDLLNRLLGDAPINALSGLERSRIITRTRAFREQLAAALHHPEFGRMDLTVLPSFFFNALRVLIFENEFNKGRWEWQVAPDETVDFLIKHTPLKPEFPVKLVSQYEAATRDRAGFDERLIPKCRALLEEMLWICSCNSTWESLEKLNSMPDEEHLAISVAIITARRPAQLERCLQSIARLEAPPAELIIVENGGGSAVLPAVERYHASYPVRFLRCDKTGVAQARNMAIRAAEGDIIAFVDDDACVTAEWLERLERVFLRDPQIGLASGTVLNMQLGREDKVYRFMELVEKL